MGTLSGYEAKHPKNIENLPKEAFFAILRPKSVTIPYDDNYNTSEELWELEVYDNEVEWEMEVQELVKGKGSKKDFLPVKIVPATIETKVSISVN